VIVRLYRKPGGCHPRIPSLVLGSGFPSISVESRKLVLEGKPLVYL
jgi:hypothetical protein